MAKAKTGAERRQVQQELDRFKMEPIFERKERVLIETKLTWIERPWETTTLIQIALRNIELWMKLNNNNNHRSNDWDYFNEDDKEEDIKEDEEKYELPVVYGGSGVGKSRLVHHVMK